MMASGHCVQAKRSHVYRTGAVTSVRAGGGRWTTRADRDTLIQDEDHMCGDNTEPSHSEERSPGQGVIVGQHTPHPPPQPPVRRRRQTDRDDVGNNEEPEHAGVPY